MVDEVCQPVRSCTSCLSHLSPIHRPFILQSKHAGLLGVCHRNNKRKLPPSNCMTVRILSRGLECKRRGGTPLGRQRPRTKIGSRELDHDGYDRSPSPETPISCIFFSSCSRTCADTCRRGRADGLEVDQLLERGGTCPAPRSTFLGQGCTCVDALTLDETMMRAALGIICILPASRSLML